VLSTLYQLGQDPPRNHNQQQRQHHQPPPPHHQHRQRQQQLKPNHLQLAGSDVDAVRAEMAALVAAFRCGL
jgi:hypothetical protein